MKGFRGFMMSLRIALGTASVLALASSLHAQDTVPGYSRTEAMIPTRDGVKLNTQIYTPKDQSGPLPFILMRTPYGIDGSSGNFRSYFKELAEERYIFVF